jgi:hypothetical protein
MTDYLFGDDDSFDDGFFASLAASPDDPASAYEAEFAPDNGSSEDGYFFLYEAEGDGRFESDADGLDIDDESFDYNYDDAFEPDPEAGGQPVTEPDFDPDHDFDHEGDHEFSLDFGRGFGPGL